MMTSPQFMDRLNKITEEVVELRRDLVDASFKNYLSETDKNYGTECLAAQRVASRHIDAVFDALNELYEELSNTE